MNEQLVEILKFANQNPSSWLATCDDNVPFVRGMLLWFADETGLYYHTGRSKSLYQQIIKNPRAEVAFIRNADSPDFEMLRVNGTVEIVEDKELRKRLLQERSWIKDNIERSGVDTDLVIFRIVKGTAHIFNMSWNCKEDQAPRVYF